jgi:sirohydrochlorin ferrochelatase
VKTAVIVLGHGSRQEGADAPLAELAAGLRSSGAYAMVEQAFLQYVPPTLPDTVKRCVAGGAEQIVIVPFFLQPGAHVTRDIPEAVVALHSEYPQVRFSVTGHVGGHPLMAQIVEELVKNANA